MRNLRTFPATKSAGLHFATVVAAGQSNLSSNTPPCSSPQLPSKNQTTMGVVHKAADLAQKGAVLGLMSLFGYQVYQISANVIEERSEGGGVSHTAIMKKINDKVAEESKFATDKIPDRYDPEDNSYLKQVPNLQKQDS